MKQNIQVLAYKLWQIGVVILLNWFVILLCQKIT